MTSRKIIARQALRGALDIRQRAGVQKDDPICIYDVAERLGVEVKFCGGNSFGGMYAKASKTILVPALRPAGRQAFTCAHELAHWYFGHGTRVDELTIFDSNLEVEPEEGLANLFAAYLLMPPWAVEAAFAKRNWHIATCTPFQAYIIAGQLGVGYETLIQHLKWSLCLIQANHADKLLKTTPKQLKHFILGYDYVQHLSVADHAWNKVPVDLQVGELGILPEGVTCEGNSISTIGNNSRGLLIEAREAGISRAFNSDCSWATYIRVSRKNFEGRCIYRHLEDPDVNTISSVHL